MLLFCPASPAPGAAPIAFRHARHSCSQDAGPRASSMSGAVSGTGQHTVSAWNSQGTAGISPPLSSRCSTPEDSVRPMWKPPSVAGAAVGEGEGMV